MPPPLPSGELRPVPGRGQVWFRSIEGPSGSLPVVLLHGWMATADLNFFPLFAPLGRRHRVIAPDLRGHGRSLFPQQPVTLEDAADDVAALMRDLGTGPAIVVGYSLGTTVAQTLVARHPDLVAAIVLAAGELHPGRRIHERLLQRFGGWQGSIQRLSNGRWLAHRMVDKAGRLNPSAEGLRQWLVSELERGHPAALRAAGRAHARFDGRAIAARATVPAVVVVTGQDRLVVANRQRRLAEAWRANVVDLDADHDAPVAHPERFVAAMLEAVETARGLAATRPAEGRQAVAG